jgi:hypothetical protein
MHIGHTAKLFHLPAGRWHHCAQLHFAKADQDRNFTSVVLQQFLQTFCNLLQHIQFFSYPLAATAKLKEAVSAKHSVYGPFHR